MLHAINAILPLPFDPGVHSIVRLHSENTMLLVLLLSRSLRLVEIVSQDRKDCNVALRIRRSYHVTRPTFKSDALYHDLGDFEVCFLDILRSFQLKNLNF